MPLNLEKKIVTRQYYYTRNDERFGPFELTALIELIKPDDLVWRDGIEWTKAKQLSELKRFFADDSKQKKTSESAVKNLAPSNWNSNVELAKTLLEIKNYEAAKLEIAKVPLSENSHDISTLRRQIDEAYSKSARNNVSKKIAIWLFVLAVCVGGGYYGLKYSKEQDDFNLAKKADSERGYFEFLLKYPNGFFTDEATELHKKLIDRDTKTWTEAFLAKSPSMCQQYIDQFGSKEGRFLASANAMLDSLDFEAAITMNTSDAYKYYLAKHPAGRYSADAGRYLNLTISDAELFNLKSIVSAYLNGSGYKSIETLLPMFAISIENYKGMLNIDKSILYEAMVEEFAKFDSCRYFFDPARIQCSKDDYSNYYITLTTDNKLYRNGTQQAMAGDMESTPVLFENAQCVFKLNREFLILSYAQNILSRTEPL